MVETDQPRYKEYAIEEFLVRDEPYYRAIGDEEELFTAAYHQHIPVLRHPGRELPLRHLAARPDDTAKHLRSGGARRASGRARDHQPEASVDHRPPDG